MRVPERQSFLGGELSYLAWEDLNSHELVIATQGSPAQAEAILPLVDAQIDPAIEFDDDKARTDFGMTRHTLLGIIGLNASPKELARRVADAHKSHSVIRLSDLAISADKHLQVTRKDNPKHGEFRVVGVLALFLANFNNRSLSAAQYSYTLLVTDFAAYRALL